MSAIKKRSPWLIVAFNLLVICVILILAELGFLMFSKHRFLTPEEYRDVSLQYAPSIFSRHVFPQKEVMAERGQTRRYYINEKGYRGQPFATVKPEGTIRIMFYGGSQVFDSPADLARDWPHLVEYALKDDGLKNVEVINAGTPGHATFDSLGRYLAEGHLFHPDYVVLCHAWNDIKYFYQDTPLLRQFSPHDESKDPRISYQNAIDRLLGDNSQIYLHLRNWYYRTKLNLGQEGQKTKIDLQGTIQPEALDQFRITVATFVDLVRNSGAVPILMTQPRLVASDNTVQQWRRIAYEYVHLDHPKLVEAFKLTDDIYRQVAREKQIPLIDASGELTGENDNFMDHVHLKPKGAVSLARITAGRLADIIRQSQTPPLSDDTSGH